MPAPTITKAASGTNSQPSWISTSLKNGSGKRARQLRRAELHEEQRRGGGDGEFDQQPDPAGEAVGLAAGHLEIVVVEADGAEAQRHRQHGPDIEIGQVGPQQGADENPGQDHEAAHGRGALLLDDVALRAVGADRLTLALL